MADFDTAIALRPGPEVGVLEGVLDRDWWGGVGPHGGYLAAILVRGLQTAAGDGGRRPRLPRSLSIHYLRPARQGGFELRWRIERKGRSMSTVTLRIVQGGEPVAIAVGVVAAGRAGPELSQVAMPDVPPWRDVEPTSFGRVRPAFIGQMEFRHCVGPPPMSAAEEAESGGWVRIPGRSLDIAAVALFMDAWWPAIWPRVSVVPRVPTIDLTLHFRGEPPATDEPVLARFRSRLASGGFVDEDGELWSADGKLLAQSRQLALLLAPPD
ncbi:MAG TPA: thioesterase family protein [Thermoleophilaceae bacterium]|jgi:acyl-CoA thioesterase